MAPPRIYVTGRIAIEHAGMLVDERHFPGRQGRLALAYLISRRHAPVRRDELTDIIWPANAPRDTDTAVSAILSKLRGTLKKAGLEAPGTDIDTRMGAVVFRLPVDTWIDLEAAANAVDEAEGAQRAGHPAVAWSLANVCVSVTRRPFLPDEDAAWIDAVRTRLRNLLVRGLDLLASASAENQESPLAVQYAAEAVDLEPFRETGYQHLMLLHARNGNHAEALRVFDRCRTLLKEELGASPSPQTEAVFMGILRAGR